ncbi:hypothetical protein AMQ83_14165, partial [Paenibacillus riograndensis]
MLALVKIAAIRKTVLCLAAAAMLWGDSDAVAAAPAGNKHAVSSEAASGKESLSVSRKQLYDQMNAATGNAWIRFAAINQYERTFSEKKTGTAAQAQPRLTGISLPPPVLCGLLNPKQDDQRPESLRVFGELANGG